jgi:hypothetical protein
VDECATGAYSCPANSHCVNTTGAYACECDTGYQQSGSACGDIDECKTDNGGCSPHATCTNTLGSRTCQCIGPHYAGDGLTCAWDGLLQMGGTGLDAANALAIDSQGNIFVAGTSDTDLGASEPAGSAFHAVLLKIAPDGVVLWRKLLASSGGDYGNDVAVDADGNSYVVGETDGDLFGAKGVTSGFIVSFDASGRERWHKVIEEISHSVHLMSVATFGGNVYLAGHTNAVGLGTPQGGFDFYVGKFASSNGAFVWQSRVGSAGEDQAYALAVSSTGQVFVAGHTRGDFASVNQGLADFAVAAFSPDGVPVYKSQFGTSATDKLHGVAVDADGNAVAVGETLGAFATSNGGQGDGVVVWLGADGAVKAQGQFGSTGVEMALNVLVDGGTTHLVGSANSTLDGVLVTGWSDGVWLQYEQGARVAARTRFVGTAGVDALYDIAKAPDGSFWGVGYTDGSLSGFTNVAQGMDDLMLIRLRAP